MSIDVLASSTPADVQRARRLLLIWQNPETRRFIRVGKLDQLTDGRFAFRYLPEAGEPGFSPLVQFPDLGRRYLSEQLPAFFANRVMSRARSRYGEFRQWIGLEEEGSDTPFEVLIRTGAPRATDTFHVVDDLTIGHDGRVVSRFLASGIRHIEGAKERLRTLSEGQALCLRDDLANKANSRAILIDVRDGEAVGWVPDWLLEDVHRLRRETAEFNIYAEHINPDAPPHLQLLCRIDASVATPTDL
jgi:hypothetical protein